MFSTLLDRAIELGEQYLYKIPTNDYTLYSAGLDFGFGSSSILQLSLLNF